MFAIVRENKPTSYLTSFAPGDLPIKKYNSKKDTFTFSYKNIISFSRSCYNIFLTPEDAARHILYIKKEINEPHNVERYNTISLKCIDELNKIVDSLTIVKSRD